MLRLLPVRALSMGLAMAIVVVMVVVGVVKTSSTLEPDCTTTVEAAEGVSLFFRPTVGLPAVASTTFLGPKAESPVSELIERISPSNLLPILGSLIFLEGLGLELNFLEHSLPMELLLLKRPPVRSAGTRSWGDVLEVFLSVCCSWGVWLTVLLLPLMDLLLLTVWALPLLLPLVVVEGAPTMEGSMAKAAGCGKEVAIMAMIPMFG